MKALTACCSGGSSRAMGRETRPVVALVAMKAKLGGTLPLGCRLLCDSAIVMQ